MKTVVNVEERPFYRPGRAESPFGEILVPTDFSSRSDQAINYGIDSAKRLGSHLTLLHVVPAPYAIDYTSDGILNGEWKQFGRPHAPYSCTEGIRKAVISNGTPGRH